MKNDHNQEPKKSAEWLLALKFVLFSLSAGVVQLGSFSLLNEILHWPYWISFGIALALSVVWNFTFNRKFTFRSASNVPIAMLKAAAFYIPYTPLSLWIEYKLADLGGWNEYLVTGINMAINLVTEFLWQRYYVFRDSINTTNPEEPKEE